MLFGAHVSSAGGIYSAVGRATDLGCRSLPGLPAEPARVEAGRASGRGSRALRRARERGRRRGGLPCAVPGQPRGHGRAHSRALRGGARAGPAHRRGPGRARRDRAPGIAPRERLRSRPSSGPRPCSSGCSNWPATAPGCCSRTRRGPVARWAARSRSWRSWSSAAAPIRGSGCASTARTCSARASTSATWPPSRRCSTSSTRRSGSTGSRPCTSTTRRWSSGQDQDRHANVGEGLIGDRMAAFLGRPPPAGPAGHPRDPRARRQGRRRALHAAARPPLAPGAGRMTMRVAVVDPQAYTPPYDDELCRALSAAGAEVELLTAHFTHGEPPGGARLRAPRAVRPPARGPDRAPSLVARAHPAEGRRAPRRAGPARAPRELVATQHGALAVGAVAGLGSEGAEGRPQQSRRDRVHGARRAAPALARRRAAVGGALRQLRARDRARRGQSRPPARGGRRRHARADRRDPARAAARRLRRRCAPRAARVAHPLLRADPARQGPGPS